MIQTMPVSLNAFIGFCDMVVKVWLWAKETKTIVKVRSLFQLEIS